MVPNYFQYIEQVALMVVYICIGTYIYVVVNLLLAAWAIKCKYTINDAISKEVF